jgi:hypothetical protein
MHGGGQQGGAAPPPGGGGGIPAAIKLFKLPIKAVNKMVKLIFFMKIKFFVNIGFIFET